jgi:glycerophosphoryl diester phosphodiesterase
MIRRLFERTRAFISKHRRTLGWLALVLVTGWLPLVAVGVAWWEFKDEIYPAPRIYEAAPADKLAKFVEGEGPPLVFSHRGDHLFAGQNSFESFERSIFRGYDGIELDVIMSGDEVPVVAHNFSLSYEDQSLYVPEATADDIRSLADSLPDEQGTRFRTLDETLERFANKTLFIIELKAEQDESFGVEAPVCELIHEHGAAGTVILSSLKYHVLETLEQTPACEGIARMYEVSGSGGDPPEGYDRPVLGMRHDFLAERKARAPESVRAFSVYTPNRAYFIGRAIEDGALLIQTDRPGRAMRIRDEMVDW